MRNIAINDVDHLPRRVLGPGSDYPPDTLYRAIITGERSFSMP